VAPIKYAPDAAGGYAAARLCDYSRAGFGIEPIQPIEPGRRFYLLPSHYEPGTYGPEAYRAYQVRIQWCREKGSGGDFPYRAGAQILSMHHELSPSPERRDKKHCDLCGRPTEKGELLPEAGAAELCRHCHAHLTRIRDHRLKENIRHFIAGNVLGPHPPATSDGSTGQDLLCPSDRPPAAKAP
jgi:hypothetical protein